MVSNNVIIWLCVQISLIHQFSRIIILKFFVEMFLISLQYLLLFLLKEQTVFLLAFFFNKESGIQNFFTS